MQYVIIEKVKSMADPILKNQKYLPLLLVLTVFVITVFIIASNYQIFIKKPQPKPVTEEVEYEIRPEFIALPGEIIYLGENQFDLLFNIQYLDEWQEEEYVTRRFYVDEGTEILKVVYTKEFQEAMKTENPIMPKMEKISFDELKVGDKVETLIMLPIDEENIISFKIMLFPPETEEIFESL